MISSGSASALSLGLSIMKVREAPQDKERTELTREIPWVAVGVPVLSIITTWKGFDSELSNNLPKKKLYKQNTIVEDIEK